MFERMEGMNDMRSMTLEGIFLQDYARLREENESLRQQIAEAKKANSGRYGVFDLGEPVDMVKVSVQSPYVFSGGYGMENLSADEVEAIRDSPADDFKKWATTFNIYYGDNPVKIERKRYAFSVRVVDMDGERCFAFDPRKNESLVLLGECEDFMADNLDAFMPADMEDELVNAALQEVRELLEKTVEKKREKEQEEEQGQSKEE